MRLELSRNHRVTLAVIFIVSLLVAVFAFFESWSFSLISASVVFVLMSFIDASQISQSRRTKKSIRALESRLTKSFMDQSHSLQTGLYGLNSSIKANGDTLKEEIDSIAKALGSVEEYVHRTAVASRKGFKATDGRLDALQASVGASVELLRDVQEAVPSKEEISEIHLQGRKVLNLVRSEFPETRESVRKVESLVAALADQTGIAERKVMNRLRNDSAVEAVRSRLEHAERRILGTLEEERLSSADRWVDIQQGLAAHELVLSRQAVDFGTRVLDALRENHESIEDVATTISQRPVVDPAVVVEQVVSSQKAIVQAVEEATSRIRQRLVSHVTHTVRDDTRQVEALLQLLPRMPEVPAQLPPTGGFAIDAQALLHLIEILERERPKLILELGGGTSTIWMGHICRPFGTRIVSVDHLDHYNRQTQELVDRHGLNDVVECRLAPLEELVLGDSKYQWYSGKALDDIGSVDLLLVDGPPEAVGDRARFPAMPILETKMSSSATIVLDDTHREGEQAILQDWCSQAPDFEHKDHGVSRLGVLRRRGGTDS